MKKLDKTYMKVAESFAENSRAVRMKVGACLVTKNGVILSGYNGTPNGFDNNCEYETFTEFGLDGSILKEKTLVTKPEVVHAEINCISKAAREGVSVMGSTLYVTLSPCVECAKILIQSGVTQVVYKQMYRDSSGIELLKKANVEVNQFDDGVENV